VDEIRRIIDRATFGWTPPLDLEVRALGVEAWLDQQVDPNGTTTPALSTMLAPWNADTNPGGYRFLSKGNLANHPWTGASGFDTGTPVADRATARETAAKYEPRHATLLRAVYSRRQLYEVMVDFWSNHFSISLEGRFYLRHLRNKTDRTVARAHALGRFADLLQASAHDTSMLIYLDNWRSEADPEAGPLDPPGVNENYGRELIELHTLGIIDGQHVYTEDDVVAAAKILSGWSIGGVPSNTDFSEPGEWAFEYRHASHWKHGATFLAGHPQGEFVQPAGLGSSAAYQSGVDFLVFLARHPSTARYLAYKLCKRFVTDDPMAETPDLVDRAALAYLEADTAIVPMVREILVSPELQAAGPRMRRGFEAVAFQLRATGATIDPRPRGDSFAGASTYLHEPSDGLLSGFGQGLFLRPSPDGYPEAAGEWLSSDAMLRRWNLAGALASNTANQGIEVPTPVLAPLGAARTVGELVDEAATRLLGPAEPLAPSGFPDVAATHQFAVDIAWMKVAGITTGNADGTYKPGSPVSRQAMAAFLHRLGDPGGTFVPPAQPSFADVPPSNPFFVDIEWMKAEGISTGTPGSGGAKPAYKPFDPVSRQAMAAFLHRLGDPDGVFEAPAEGTFSDVTASHPFFADVEWMAWAGISTGNADGTYQPGAAVSRQAMAAFLHRFAVQSPSMLPPEERAAIVAAFGGEATVIHPLDADGVRNDVVALVLSTPMAVQR
jgi:uncharacterized protein (DUF1800 family)